jgi:hypothetical protein
MRINRCRLSSVWTASIPELLGNAAPGPMGDLMNPSKYSAIFNELLGGGNNPVVDLPWHHKPGSPLPERNNYWTDAIVRNFMDHPGADRGRLAWKAAVQLKHKGDLLGVAYGDRSFVEGWYFPTGIALSITVWVSGDLDGDQLKQKVSDFSGAQLLVTLAGKKSFEFIDDAAGKAMDLLRQQGFGLPPISLSEKPTRILTMIAAGHDPQEKEKDAAEAAMLRDVLISAGASPAAKVMPAKDIYALPHARVIWRPDCFLSPQKGLHKLGCLHRNVTVSTMHVASIIRAAEVMMAEINDSGKITPRVEMYGRPIAGLLGRLNSLDDRYVYKLQCLRDQITEAKATINHLRDRFDMSPLQ